MVSMDQLDDPVEWLYVIHVSMSYSVVLMGKSTWAALTRSFIEERAVEHDAEGGKMHQKL